MIEQWKMDNQFSIAEWETQANYDLAVFRIDTEATLAQWSAQTDIYKMGINQAYQTQNLNLAAQIASDYQAAQAIIDENLLNIKLEAEERQADTEGFWGFIGALFGWIFG